MEQYELTYFAVIDKLADKAIAVSTLCLFAYYKLESRTLNYDQFDFVELNKAEYDTYISMEVLPYREIFQFLTNSQRVY